MAYVGSTACVRVRGVFVYMHYQLHCCTSVFTLTACTHMYMYVLLYKESVDHNRCKNTWQFFSLATYKIIIHLPV